jgi:hypothetical protein
MKAEIRDDLTPLTAKENEKKQNQERPIYKM